MIFVSTGGYKNQLPSQSINYLFNNGINNIELSGGLFEENLLEKLLKLKNRINFQIHNYFPVPKIPFVLNLASLNEEVSALSMVHMETAIKWSAKLGSKSYSFHAGFLIDPRPNELGKKISNREINNREEGLSLFIERVNSLADFAKNEDVELLIENNVLSKKNYQEFNGNPLLMVEPNECLIVMNNTPDNVNMLLDVAHLKVSANTLEFDPITSLNDINKWIKGYHFSDNDGLSDTNQMISESSWFINNIDKNKSCVLEVYDISVSKIKEQLLILNRLFLGV